MQAAAEIAELTRVGDVSQTGDVDAAGRYRGQGTRVRALYIACLLALEMLRAKQVAWVRVTVAGLDVCARDIRVTHESVTAAGRVPQT